MENIIYACLCINPNFHYINLTLLINFLKTIHEYSSLKIPSCRSQYTMLSPRRKAWRKTKMSPEGLYVCFFQAVCAENGIFCESAGGKSNIFKMLSDRAGENVLVVADGTAFGSQMERIMQLLALQPDSHIYLPESFEWLILRSGFNNAENCQSPQVGRHIRPVGFVVPSN